MSARSVTHACPPSRAVTYFLEPLLLLAPFMREPLACPQGESQSAQGVQLPGVLTSGGGTLTGITNHPEDLTVDTFRTVPARALGHGSDSAWTRSGQHGLLFKGGHLCSAHG